MDEWMEPFFSETFWRTTALFWKEEKQCRAPQNICVEFD
jgi:hypothetical protein